MISYSMRTRRIVQIAASEKGLHALCDDGSVWLKGPEDAWVSYDPIPQPRLADPFEGVGVGEQPEGPVEKLL